MVDIAQFPHLDFARPYSAHAMQRHIDILLLPLSDHLVAELETLTPEYLEVVGQKGLDEVGSRVERHLKGYDPAWFLCSLFGECAAWGSR